MYWLSLLFKHNTFDYNIYCTQFFMSFRNQYRKLIFCHYKRMPYRNLIYFKYVSRVSEKCSHKKGRSKLYNIGVQYGTIKFTSITFLHSIFMVDIIHTILLIIHFFLQLLQSIIQFITIKTNWFCPILYLYQLFYQGNR